MYASILPCFSCRSIWSIPPCSPVTLSTTCCTPLSLSDLPSLISQHNRWSATPWRYLCSSPRWLHCSQKDTPLRTYTHLRTHAQTDRQTDTHASQVADRVLCQGGMYWPDEISTGLRCYYCSDVITHTTTIETRAHPKL